MWRPSRRHSVCETIQCNRLLDSLVSTLQTSQIPVPEFPMSRPRYKAPASSCTSRIPQIMHSIWQCGQVNAYMLYTMECPGKNFTSC